MIITAIKKGGRITRPLGKWILSIFFDPAYLTGRHFDDSFIGFAWALRTAWQRNILRLAPALPWPAALTCRVANPKNICFDPDDINIFQSPGLYLQNFAGRIALGKGTYLGPNVGIITANHRLDALDEHEVGRDVRIGERCWLGMNVVLLPGVVLGHGTIVAAGSVVTKSFPDGNVILGGVPAKVIRRRDAARRLSLGSKGTEAAEFLLTPPLPVSAQ